MSRTYFTSADNAFVLEVAERALVTDANKSGWADVAVADGTLTVALVAEASDGDAGLLTAHDQIAEVLSVCAVKVRER